MYTYFEIIIILTDYKELDIWVEHIITMITAIIIYYLLCTQLGVLHILLLFFRFKYYYTILEI